MAIDTPLPPGTAVEVSNLFTGQWSTGFRVIAREAGGYRVERMSDGSELPVLLAAPRVRAVAGAGAGLVAVPVSDSVSVG